MTSLEVQRSFYYGDREGYSTILNEKRNLSMYGMGMGVTNTIKKTIDTFKYSATDFALRKFWLNIDYEIIFNRVKLVKNRIYFRPVA